MKNPNRIVELQTELGVRVDLLVRYVDGLSAVPRTPDGKIDPYGLSTEPGSGVGLLSQFDLAKRVNGQARRIGQIRGELKFLGAEPRVVRKGPERES